jgi:hypothetical protein
MANVNAPMGFRLILTGGHEPIRRQRHADALRDATNGAIASGDAVFIAADGFVDRCSGGEQPNAIVEGLALKGVNEGPVSYSFLPGNVAGDLICIEDPTAQFETQTNATIPAANFDAAAEVNVVDANPDETLAQSRQQVGDVGGNQLRLVAPIDRPDNVAYAQYQKVVVGLIPANVQ